MAPSRRSALVILLLGVSLLAGFLLRGFFLEFIVKPAVLLGWLFVRTLQSLDQQVYWGMLIAFTAVYVVVRLARKLADVPPVPVPESNITLDQINQWRTLIPLSGEEIGKSNILKHNLAKMLTTIFTSRQPESVHWEVDEALRLRRIPIPDALYAFLFSGESQEEGPALRRALRSLGRAPGDWLRRISGRETAEYYRSIDNVLAYLEISMEKKHDP